jgi:UDP-N-acetylmuramate--alanine ligase
VLRECGADPGYVIGGILTETGLGAEDGSGLDFVAEADESDGSFLLLSPDLAIITNVEADHLDNYASLADIQAAFTTFGLRVSGIVLTCADDPGAEAVAARLDPARVRRYGESRHADYRLTDVASRGMAISFTVAADHGPFGEIFTQMTVDVPGHHNALNATAAFAAAIELGFAPPRVAAAIAGYRGARRRMELKGEARGVRVLDSYAHHPTELAADLRAARAGSSRSSSRTCSAGPGSSRPSSAPRSRWPTRPSCSTCTPPGRTRNPASPAGSSWTPYPAGTPGSCRRRTGSPR